MNFLLKIVQGPNAGAEVALIEGLCVKLGRADSCDLVLADPTLPEVACELDTSADRVMLFLPGGVQERLEPLHVRFFGATALAVGPADAPWGELVWPAPAGAPAAEVPAPQPAAETNPERRARKGHWKGILAWLCLLLLLTGVLILCYLFWEPLVEKGEAGLVWARDTWRHMTTPPPPPPKEIVTLEVTVQNYGLEMERHEGAPTRVWGNLTSRAKRLQATAEIYTAEPGALVQLSDDESLTNAADETLAMLTDGRVRVVEAKNRALTLAGGVESTSAMRVIAEALKAEVPYLEHLDCAQVVCGKREGGDGAEQAVAAKARENRALTTLPFCGILTTPYPCIVLRDGSRVTPGAEFGGFVVDKIEPDRIVIHNADGAFDWRP